MNGVPLILRIKSPYPYFHKNHVRLFFRLYIAKSKVVVRDKVCAAAETVGVFGIVRLKPRGGKSLNFKYGTTVLYVGNKGVKHNVSVGYMANEHASHTVVHGLAPTNLLYAVTADKNICLMHQLHEGHQQSASRDVWSAFECVRIGDSESHPNC